MIINLAKVPFIDCTEKNINELKFHDLTSSCSSLDYVTEKTNYIELYDSYLIKIIRENDFFSTNLSTIVPQDILEKIKNKKLFLLLFFCDPTNNLVDKTYSNIILEQNIPYEQIIIVSSSPDLKYTISNVSKQYGIGPIKYQFYNWLERSIQRSLLTDMEIDTGYNENKILDLKSPLLRENFKKKFICLNRNWRENRGAMLILLDHFDLVKHGHISFSKMGDWDIFYQKILNDFNHEELLGILQKGNYIQSRLPLLLDTNLEGYLAGFSRSMVKFYNETYFSVVNETFFLEKYPFFTTEKIFKPILHKHPFIVAATPNYLKKLRNLGYKTFENLIDESYDDELNSNTRLLKIVEEIKRMCNFTDKELNHFRQEALPIVQYNFELLMSKTSFIYEIN